MSVIRIPASTGVLLIHTEQHTPAHSIPTARKRRSKKSRESRKDKRERLARLAHEPVPRLFQMNPPLKKPSLFPQKGYTDSIQSFWRASDQRRKVVARNNRILGRRFTHLCNINLQRSHHPALINRDFKQFLKHLASHGVSGHWTIQIDRNNLVHWHLLFQNYCGTRETLKRLVYACLRTVKTFPARRVFTAPITQPRNKLEYVLQVKKAGYDKISALPCDDLYARSRILFKPSTGLAKNGSFGDFWAKQANGKPHSERTLWKLIQTETAAVARNYEIPQLRKLVHEWHERFGIPIARVKWQICIDPSPELLRPERRPRVSPSGRTRKTTSLLAAVFRKAIRPPTCRRRQVGDPQCSPHLRGISRPIRPRDVASVSVLRDTNSCCGLTHLLQQLASKAAAWISKVFPKRPAQGPGP